MTRRIPLISVIIPVYNTASYLTECLDSVVNQNMSDMEIIVVNDGSTDGSLDIIRRYSERDERIILLNKANQGVSAARNEGIKIAKADYIIFLDSDDVFTAGAIKIVYDQICRIAGDMLIFNGRAFEDEGNTKIWSDKSYFNLDRRDENHIAPGLYWIKHTGGCIQAPGMKIYRRAFIVENGLQYGDSLVGEDYYFFYMCMIRAERVGYLHFEGYSRRYRPGSQETDKSIHGTRERIRSFGQILSTLNFIEDEKYRRIIAAQHAYYASVLWVRCMIRQTAYERDALLKEFRSARLNDFIRGNRHDWKLCFFDIVISFPDFLNWLQIIFARTVRWTFKSKTRLL